MSGQPLDYAPPLPWHRRRGLHRWLIAGALALTLLSSVKWAPPAWRHAQLLYWQRQCMTYMAPADAVVVQIDTPEASIVPAEWSAFRAVWASAYQSDGTLFLHARQTPAGRTWLIAVDFHATGGGVLATRSIQPATLGRRSSDSGGRAMGGSFFGMTPGARFFAGQPDRDDPSHFTIEYEVNGRREILDGWLDNDGRVKIEPRR
jgi:hypothetical protein